MKKIKNTERIEFIALKSLLREKKKTYWEMAGILGISASTFSKKINGYSEFILSEMLTIMSYLNVDPPRVNWYFFDGIEKRTA